MIGVLSSMRVPSGAETEQRQFAKPVRVILRLKHSLPEGAVIHAVLPDTLLEFEETLARGELDCCRAALTENAVLRETDRSREPVPRSGT